MFIGNSALVEFFAAPEERNVAERTPLEHVAPLELSSLGDVPYL